VNTVNVFTVTHLKESWYTYECIMPNIRMRHATHMNAVYQMCRHSRHSQRETRWHIAYWHTSHVPGHCYHYRALISIQVSCIRSLTWIDMPIQVTCIDTKSSASGHFYHYSDISGHLHHYICWFKSLLSIQVSCIRSLTSINMPIQVTYTIIVLKVHDYTDLRDLNRHIYWWQWSDTRHLYQHK